MAVVPGDPCFGILISALQLQILITQGTKKLLRKKKKKRLFLVDADKLQGYIQESKGCASAFQYMSRIQLRALYHPLYNWLV